MSNSFTRWTFPGKHPFCIVKQRFERALSHNSGYIHRAACCGSYMGVTMICVWERTCAFSQGLVDRLPDYPGLYDDNVFIWLFCFVCMCMDSQSLIKRSRMMLVISILTHVTSGHPDWITWLDLRHRNTWLHISRPWNFHTETQLHKLSQQAVKKKVKVKQKSQNNPEFDKQNDLYCLKTDQSWKTSCLLLTALSETSVVPTVPWRYSTVCVARFAFSLLLCVSAVTRDKTNAEETKDTSTVGGICEKMFLKLRITWLTKFPCFLLSFVRPRNLFPIFPPFSLLLFTLPLHLLLML